jgi:septation ring formation regulator EzrA
MVKTYIDRVKQEQVALQEKIDKLYSFIDGDFNGVDVSKTQADLLNKQLVAMKEYNSCLLDRIDDLDKNG